MMLVARQVPQQASRQNATGSPSDSVFAWFAISPREIVVMVSARDRQSHEVRREPDASIKARPLSLAETTSASMAPR